MSKQIKKVRNLTRHTKKSLKFRKVQIESVKESKSGSVYITTSKGFLIRLSDHESRDEKPHLELIVPISKPLVDECIFLLAHRKAKDDS